MDSENLVYIMCEDCATLYPIGKQVTLYALECCPFCGAGLEQMKHVSVAVRPIQ